MIIRTLFSVALIVLCQTANPAWARTIGETNILNEGAFKRLKANKGVKLQWLWEAKPGTLTVAETPDGITLKGGQGPHQGDELTIDGVVLNLDARNFTFRGKIVIVDNETASPCVRDGVYTFRITGSRKFWRMKEQIAGCEGRADLTDYVDILF